MAVRTLPWWQQEGLSSDPGVTQSEYMSGIRTPSDRPNASDSTFGTTGGSSSTQFNNDGTANTTGQPAGLATGGGLSNSGAGTTSPNAEVGDTGAGNAQNTNSTFNPNQSDWSKLDFSNNPLVKSASDLALSQGQNSLNQSVSDLAKKMMDSANFDYSGYNQQQMDAFNADRQKQMEQVRQQNADTANTGNTQAGMLDLALQTDRDRAALRAANEKYAREQSFKDMGTALTAGEAAMSATNQDISDRINNLKNAYGMTEGDRQRQSQQLLNDIDNQYQLAVQENNIVAQARLQSQRLQVETDMQTAGFTQEERMAFVDGEIKKSLQNNEFEHARELQRSEFLHKSQEAANDRAVEYAKLKLQQQGVDMARAESTFNMISEMEQNGQARPGDAVSYLNGVLAQAGVTGEGLLQMPSEDDLYAGLNAKFEQEQYQYMQSHPTEVEVTDTGREAYAAAIPSFTTPTDAQIIAWATQQGANASNYLQLNATGTENFQNYLNEAYWTQEDGTGTTGTTSGSTTASNVYGQNRTRS